MYYLSEIKSGNVIASYESLDGIPVNGFRITKVPSHIKIDVKDRTGSVLNYKDVVRQKYQGMLQTLPLFTEVFWGQLEDESEFYNPEIQGNGSARGHGIYWIGEDQSLITIAKTISVPKDRFAVHCDTYTLDRVVEGSRVNLYYREVSIPLISINNQMFDSYWTSAQPYLTPIVFPLVGDNIRIGLGNTNPERIYLGGYAVFH